VWLVNIATSCFTENGSKSIASYEFMVSDLLREKGCRAHSLLQIKRSGNGSATVIRRSYRDRDRAL
jgi:hypothetical protein